MSLCAYIPFQFLNNRFVVNFLFYKKKKSDLTTSYLYITTNSEQKRKNRSNSDLMQYFNLFINFPLYFFFLFFVPRYEFSINADIRDNYKRLILIDE